MNCKAQRFLLIFVVFPLIIYSLNCSLVGQTTKSIKPENVLLTVSEQQEENFKNFMRFLDQQKSFMVVKDSLKNIYEMAFVAMKQNNYDEYIVLKNQVDEIFEKLDNEQKSEILQFFRTLVPLKGSDTKVPANSCKVDCLFGSCEITCPDGSKPKCRCEWYGVPDCGCEPFNPN